MLQNIHQALTSSLRSPNWFLAFTSVDFLFCRLLLPNKFPRTSKATPQKYSLIFGNDTKSHESQQQQNRRPNHRFTFQILHVWIGVNCSTRYDLFDTLTYSLIGSIVNQTFFITLFDGFYRRFNQKRLLMTISRNCANLCKINLLWHHRFQLAHDVTDIGLFIRINHV